MKKCETCKSKNVCSLKDGIEIMIQDMYKVVSEAPPAFDIKVTVDCEYYNRDKKRKGSDYVKVG